MKIFFSLSLIFTGVILPFISYGQEQIVITDSLHQRIFPLSELQYYQDFSHNLPFGTISAPGFQKNFKRNPSYTSKDYNDRATYWVKMQIKHNPLSEKKWLLEFYDQRIDEIQAYIPNPSGEYRIYTAGDMQAFYNRQFGHKNFEFMLDNSSSQELTYYFRIKSKGSADIRIVLRSLNRFINYALNEYLLFGVFYGMVLIIGLYNFLMYGTFRSKKYLTYVFYLFSFAVYSLCIDGLAFQYFWPEKPHLNLIAYGIAQFSTVFWALRFTQRFLNTHHRFPTANKIIWTTIAIRSLYFLFCLLINQNFFEYGIVETLPLSVMVGTSFYALKKGYRPARFIVIAYCILLIGFSSQVLTNLGILPFTILMHYSLRFCFILEMLLLSLALADQVRILKDQKERAQKRIIQQMSMNVHLKEEVNKELAEKMKLKEKINIELEQKVRERTAALHTNNQKLEEANQKLIDQAKEINQINSILDLDNWKLKNNLKKELTDRLLQKDLDFAEFQKLYPNEKACYEHLEGFKNARPFKCRKCANEKYIESNKVYARRCTKCGKSESATSYTLFHGVKFPLEKAFFIAYLTINDHTHYTLEELANILELRKNTIWSFKRKVQGVKDYLQHKYKRQTVQWEEVILTWPATTTNVTNRAKVSS